MLWENMMLGSVAGALSAGVTTPLDVLKTRMMTQVMPPPWPALCVLPTGSTPVFVLWRSPDWDSRG